MSSSSSTLNLIKSYFFEMWLFWQPGNLNLALCRFSINILLVLQLDMDRWTWCCAVGLSKGTPYTFLEARLRMGWTSTGGVWLQGPKGQLLQAIGFICLWGGCLLQPLHSRPLGPILRSSFSWLLWTPLLFPGNCVWYLIKILLPPFYSNLFVMPFACTFWIPQFLRLSCPLVHLS
jgi:hypothetical protein